jgi:hypothetical protein
MRPEARAPRAIRMETLLCCPHCRRLAIPAGIVKRVVGLALLLPFTLVLLGGVGVALYFSVSMMSRGEVSGGFAGVALVLGGTSGFGLWKCMGPLRLLMTPGSILPLSRGAGAHRFAGEL